MAASLHSSFTDSSFCRFINHLERSRVHCFALVASAWSCSGARVSVYSCISSVLRRRLNRASPDSPLFFAAFVALEAADGADAYSRVNPRRIIAMETKFGELE